MCQSGRKEDVSLEKGKGNRRKNTVTLEHPAVGQVASAVMECRS